MAAASGALRKETGTEAAPYYTMEELRETRRNVLRYARFCPPGAQRNQHRQIARSLRRLFRDRRRFLAGCAAWWSSDQRRFT